MLLCKFKLSTLVGLTDHGLLLDNGEEEIDAYDDDGCEMDVEEVGLLVEEEPFDELLGE